LNVENKTRQETIKPTAQQPNMTKNKQSNSQYQPKSKQQEGLREPSELSLIEHASIRDFEPPTTHFPITRLTNNHWDILNDD